ncbi:MAG: glycosyltransferase [Nitrospirae bacterium]|nr:glycosyltransferase [Nitrospirota bacterium]
MKVDIIIPVKEINHYIYESVPEILKLDYEDYGVIIFPDNVNGESFPRTTISATGPMGPAQKRDLALKHSSADIIAFIDDDAYPRPDWLKNAMKHFGNPQVAAVGGPAVTPAHDSFLQRVSGAVFLTPFGGGVPERYWPIGPVREVDDWPSVNLLVRRDVFEDVGGFNSDYWPGEDTKLCLDIIRMGKKIIYDPDVYVWHHRREGLIRHLRQVGRYGLHRGFFAKKFPETSLRFKYFIPSLFTIFLISGIFLLFTGNGLLNDLYLIGMVCYVFILILAMCQIWGKEKDIAVSIACVPYIFLTHVWYGIQFLRGLLFTKELKSKLRKT